MSVAQVLARLVLPSLLAVVVAVFFVMSEPAPARASIDVPRGSSDSTRLVECPIEVPNAVEVECGELVVPEDYDQPGGMTLRLPYIILRSRSAVPEPDPLIFTAGGPGSSSLASVWLFADSRLRDDRDIIVFEQRGNRYADPALTCDPSVWWEETAGHTPCLDSIRARGIDISQYSTDNIVRDVVVLREALGYEHWNLYGGSFSTLVMLLVMDADPSGTRSAILQSVRPPSETTFAHEADSPLRAIEQMFTDCAANAQCAASYPDLADDFFALVRRLNADPVEIEIESSTVGGPIPLAIDGHRFIDWIAVNALYGPVFPHYDAAYLPLLINEVSRGNTRPLEIVAESSWKANIENPAWAWGLMLAISCQQDLPAAGTSRPEADLAASERLEGFARTASQRDICAAWDLAPLPPAGTDYVRSDVPTLVLAGSYDPVTPPVWSRTTAEHLTNSTYIEFPGRGHDVTSDNPCAAMLEALFLTDPMTELNTSCVETSPGPSFAIPDDVYRAPGLARSGHDVSLGSPGGVAWIEALAAVGIYGTFFLAAFLVILGLWLAISRHRTRRVDRTAMVAYGLALLVAATTIAIALLVTQLNDDYASRGALAFSLGPSRDLASAVLLAWISPLAGVLILALAVMTVWAWLTRRWHSGFRILTTMTVLCSLVMVMLGVRWDLFTMLV